MTALHGFEQTRQRRIDELDAVLHEYTHAASGARLCWLEREDENKAFCAAFRTLPYDDTGVFHILEHSVLCGSKQFPVKEPFVELMKGSLNTFLNALTFPDKTCYPCRQPQQPRFSQPDARVSRRRVLPRHPRKAGDLPAGGLAL